MKAKGAMKNETSMSMDRTGLVLVGIWALIDGTGREKPEILHEKEK
jgi:hypothetical protein